MQKKHSPPKKSRTRERDAAIDRPLDQLISDLEGLERLSAMQMKLIQEIRRQVDRLVRQ